MTIAERIHNGESAEQIGISLDSYTARAATLGRFLADWQGEDFDKEYRRWIAGDTAGDRGKTTRPTTEPSANQAQGEAGRPARVTITRATKPCGHCGGGRIR